jgi:hypothetical protein
MGFFSGKVNVFSTVDGVVTNKGEPIASALVKRSYSLDGNEITDSVTTDAQGKFSFDSINIKSLRALYPHNPYVFQRISIETNGQSYIAWSYQKRNYDENGERLGKPLKMHCDITNEKAVHPANEAFDYSGICTLI